jgi:hypothetical protein
MIQILENHGAAFNLQCYQGTTLEAMAKCKSPNDLSKRLLERNDLDVDMVDSVGRTIVSEICFSRT